MTEREKVIKGLELCKQDAKLCFSETECPYQCQFPRCCLKLMADALELLKEHEAVKPIYSEEKFGDFLPHCPVCKKVLPSVSQYGKSNFCYNCKQEVKWE